MSNTCIKKGSEHCSGIYELIHKWCFKPMLFFRLPAKVITFPLTSAVFCVYCQLASVVNYDGEHGKHQTVSANHQHVNIAIVSFPAWWYWQLARSGRAASQSCLHGCKLKLDYFVVVGSRFLWIQCLSSRLLPENGPLPVVFSCCSEREQKRERKVFRFSKIEELCYSKDNIYSIFFFCLLGHRRLPQVEKLNFCDTFLCASLLNIDGMCWICKKDWADWGTNQKKQKNCWLLKKLATVTTNTPVRPQKSLRHEA